MALIQLIWRIFAVGIAVGIVAGDTLVPANTTLPNSTEAMYSGQLAVSGSSPTPAVFNIVSVSLEAAEDIMPGGFTGNMVLVNSTDQAIAKNDFILLSCDPGNYPGNIQATDILDYYANSNSVQAAVFFSLTSNYCLYNGSVTGPLYSTENSSEAMSLVSYYRNVSDGYHASVKGEILGPVNNASSTVTSSPTNTNEIAMIVLYSITGIITCLFLAVIIIGGVRAHRHPERYGPRGGAGRTRQSRARGLARAMLDTLPIVRFGEREGDAEAAKPPQIEMTEPSFNGPVEELPVHAGNLTSPPDTEMTSGLKRPSVDVAAKDIQGSNSMIKDTSERGIAAAEAVDQKSPATKVHSEECAICAEEFELGQDQRVLPCNHRFHPACVDPWLLNVSGTCPLCRIDLNTPNDSTADGSGTSSAPPLAGLGDQSQRISTRRLFLNAIGTSSLDRMTLEERVSTLRDLRRQHQAARRSARETFEQHSADDAPEEEDENRVRRALRSVFHIRTRRTGDDDNERIQPDQVGTTSTVDPVPESRSTTPPNRSGH